MKVNSVKGPSGHSREKRDEIIWSWPAMRSTTFPKTMFGGWLSEPVGGRLERHAVAPSGAWTQLGRSCGLNLKTNAETP